LLRHFSIISLTPFDNDAWSTIFGKMLNWHLCLQTSSSAPFSADVSKIAYKLVAATSAVYKEVSSFRIQYCHLHCSKHLFNSAAASDPGQEPLHVQPSRFCSRDSRALSLTSRRDEVERFSGASLGPRGSSGIWRPSCR
jgi:hypothetical protein